MTTKFTLTDLAYVCLHEAGHAAATYAVGGSVEFIEILTDHAKARGRARANRPDHGVRTIAAAGFAVEYLLFRADRLLAADRTSLSEKSFIDESMNNSSEDKKSFFGSDEVQADGKWPKELDLVYMNFAIFSVAPILSPMLAQIEELAVTLEVQGRVEQEQIEHLLGISSDIA